MKWLPELDFALNRARRSTQRKAVIVGVALLFGLQVGAAAWRWLALRDAHAVLVAKQRQLASKGARTSAEPLTADQTKLAVSAQTMLNSLAVPWEVLLQAIESSRPQRVVVDAIQPNAIDGGVNIGITSPDFAEVAAFVNALHKQKSLSGVMLASEALPDNGGTALRAVIHANWQPSP
jgi:predicted dinucleotide-binding enzyme